MARISPRDHLESERERDFKTEGLVGQGKRGISGVCWQDYSDTGGSPRATRAEFLACIKSGFLVLIGARAFGGVRVWILENLIARRPGFGEAEKGLTVPSLDPRTVPGIKFVCFARSHRLAA